MDLDEIRAEALARIEASAEVSSLEENRVHYLGKTGVITALLHGLGDIDPEARPAAGAGGAAGLSVGAGCILHFLLVFLFLLAPTSNHLHELPQFGFIVVAALALSQLH